MVVVQHPFSSSWVDHHGQNDDLHHDCSLLLALELVTWRGASCRGQSDDLRHDCSLVAGRGASCHGQIDDLRHGDLLLHAHALQEKHHGVRAWKSRENLLP